MQRRKDDVTMTLILGVTLGAVLLMAVLALTCIVWLVYRRRRGRDHSASDTTSGTENTRLDPETTDNRLNESSSLPRNNAVTSPCGRYSTDGTLVLTVSNDCTGNGNDVTRCVGGASDFKKVDNCAAASASPGKSSVSGVRSDITQFARRAADDVNVWSQCDDEGRALCGFQCAVKCADDFRRLRRASASGVCDDDRKYRRKNSLKANASTKDDDCRSSGVGCLTSRYLI